VPFLFFFNAPSTSELSTLSLHDALPIFSWSESTSTVARLSTLRDPRFDALTFARPKSRILACPRSVTKIFAGLMSRCTMPFAWRSEEHTSELQSLRHLVCRLLLEKKNKK